MCVCSITYTFFSECEFLRNQNIQNKLLLEKKYKLYKPKAASFLDHKYLSHIEW